MQTDRRRCSSRSQASRTSLKVAGQLPRLYEANKMAWMTPSLFLEFVTYLDSETSCQNRKIVLILDQCPAHP
ncbi:hypothetical protein HPB48_016201 [Haemaphysalis longicornis]|uniref:DDE-1 domain-containing protein n=1 Tax=Haemaphysalis longicornis TaxID=44386 RepID=A0A9J6GGG1_HAELO|nr:hypothetical protein HPB48_016201 [Haemaphysalis longicornis]